MLNSLYLYSKNISSLLFRKERGIVLHDLHRYYINSKGRFSSHEIPAQEKERALEKAVNWLLLAKKNMPDDGIGSYHMVDGWSSSYPETSGYIIPTLLIYGGLTGNNKYIDASLEVADWLLSIQKESGGWQGGRVNENKPEIVFNTGQIIRGMLSAYAHSQDEKYIQSARRAGEWLCSVQDPQGFWNKHALMNAERVYDSYVDVPLLMLAEASNDKKFSDCAVKNLDWIVEHKQRPNGWFEDCDNTIKHNDRPIIHTIAYTIDGLIDAGINLDSDKYKEAAFKAASRLKDLFLRDSFLNGRYDSNWNGSEYMILTGCAQMSIAWMKIFILNGEQDFMLAARKMIALLIRIQSSEEHATENSLGAISGSYPIWGKYEPFAFPNWATKYFADALILEQNIHQH